jgi:hypothetical protein
MATQINIIGKHQQDKVKRTPIEFKYALNQVEPNHPDILRPARKLEDTDSPKKYNFIDLICKNYLSGYDLMFAYNFADNRHLGVLYIGHFNDGVVE